jgi:hypothetical protein
VTRRPADVLVLGGTGFLGLHVTAALRTAGLLLTGAVLGYVAQLHRPRLGELWTVVVLRARVDPSTPVSMIRSTRSWTPRSSLSRRPWPGCAGYVRGSSGSRRSDASRTPADSPMLWQYRESDDGTDIELVRPAEVCCG